MEILTADVVLPVSAKPITQGAVAHDQGRIAAVGSLAELQERFPDATLKAFAGCALLPGLINAHTHLELTHFPTDYLSMIDDPRFGMPRVKGSFVDWIIGVIQYRKTVPQQTLADAVVEGIDRSLRSGTTTVGAISTMEGEFALAEKAGIRAVMFPELISFDGDKARDCFEAAVALLDKYEGQTGLIHVGLSPHAPYTVSRSLLKIVQQYASEGKFPVQIHAAESFQEMEFFFDAQGEIADKLFPFVGWTQFKPPTVRKTPIEYLHSIDFLKCSPTLIHCVQVSDADLGRLAKSKSQVVLCPRSNHFLGVGMAPVPRLIENQVPLALGTDSLASNTSLSLWDEMRFLKRAMRLHHKVEMSAEGILQIATLGGARVLGLEKEVGSLEEGKAADLIAVRLKDWDQQADSLGEILLEHTHDPDVQMVMIQGKVIARPPRPARAHA